MFHMIHIPNAKFVLNQKSTSGKSHCFVVSIILIHFMETIIFLDETQPQADAEMVKYFGRIGHVSCLSLHGSWNSMVFLI